MCLSHCYKGIVKLFLPTMIFPSEGKGSCSKSPDIRDFTYVLKILPFPMTKWAPVYPPIIDPIWDLCTRYLLWLNGRRHCEIKFAFS